MNRKIFLITMLCVSVSIFSNIKNSVVIVKPNLHSEILKTYSDKADELEKGGKNKLSKTYRSFTENGFGSGFVISNDEGKLFILTNKHVVEFADSVTIVVEDENNQTIELNDTTLIFMDRELDLALIKCEESDNITPLNFSTSELQDGDSVWAAGFPGLMGEPGWQFSMGNITNKRATITDVTNETLKYLIQHSATIDPGNSGGPLLIKDDTQKSGFSVVGINTWSISNRNSTFFSIPSETLKQFLSSAWNSNTEDINSSVELFLGELNKQEINQELLISFISPELIASKGLPAFDSVLANSTTSLKNRWRDSFYNNSPERTLRGAIYDRIIEQYRSEDLSSLIKISQKNTTTFDIDLKLNDKKVSTLWSLNYGIWQLSDIELDVKGSVVKKNPNTGADISSAAMNLLLPGLTQFQRRDYNSSLYYGLFAVGGVMYVSMGLLDMINPPEDDDYYSNGGFPPEIMISAGAALYITSGLLSFIKEVVTD